MCGIGGFLSDAPYSHFPDLLQEMALVVEHRGPDSRGWVAFDSDGRFASDELTRTASSRDAEIPTRFSLGLCHSRLSIIDLTSSGHQPMHDGTDRYWIVFNGEIYNYLELERELAALGHRFASRTDTEVLLRAYMQWGSECLSRLNGMWAFAIFDREASTLFCARDRFGVKPFYYLRAPSGYAFASEIKQLLRVPQFLPRVNEKLLADFLFWGYQEHTRDTFFQGVRSLPPSHYLLGSTRDFLDSKCVPQRYWTPSSASQHSAESYESSFRELLSDAVRLRLRSDVPVAVTLSGGLDSTSVLCLASQHSQQTASAESIRSFSVDFALQGFSERPYAVTAAAFASSPLTVLTPDPNEASSDWKDFVWTMEEPFSSFSFFANYQIYKLIAKHGIKVVLSGQGGDELLLGYDRHRAHVLLWTLSSRSLAKPVRFLLDSRRNAGLSVFRQLLSLVYFTLPRVRTHRRARLLRPFLSASFFNEHQYANSVLYDSSLFPDARTLQLHEYFHSPLPMLLRHEDRVSMAHSIETRLPFLDYRLLELVLSLPIEALHHDGWSKSVLRESLRNQIPDEIRTRKDKVGYSTPHLAFLRANATELSALLDRHMDDPFVCTETLRAGMKSQRVNDRILTSLFSYLQWKEIFAVRA